MITLVVQRWRPLHRTQFGDDVGVQEFLGDSSHLVVGDPQLVSPLVGGLVEPAVRVSGASTPVDELREQERADVVTCPVNEQAQNRQDIRLSREAFDQVIDLAAPNSFDWRAAAAVSLVGAR